MSRDEEKFSVRRISRKKPVLGKRAERALSKVRICGSQRQESDKDVKGRHQQESQNQLSPLASVPPGTNSGFKNKNRVKLNHKHLQDPVGKLVHTHSNSPLQNHFLF